MSRTRAGILILLLVCSVVTVVEIYRTPSIIRLPLTQTKNTSLAPQTIRSNTTIQYDESNGIPKILHQIWSDDVIPNEFVENIRGLVKLNPQPEWQYWFWSLARGRRLVEKKYPKLLPIFNSSTDLMKADILRACIIHQYGGVYFDLDTVGVKPLKPFVENRTCSVVTDPPEHVVSKDMIVFVDLITNSALLCKRNHPFFLKFIQLIGEQDLTCKHAIQCAGPHLLSHLYHEMKRVNNNEILPKIENYQLFQDNYDKAATNTLKSICAPGSKYQNTDIWRRKICEEWVRRGKQGRNVSELAYTYHTWYHVGARKVTTDPKNKITNVVPHAILGGEVLE